LRFGPCQVFEPSSQPGYGIGLVPVLTAATSGGDDEPRGDVHEANPTVRRVLVLAALTAASERLDPALRQ